MFRRAAGALVLLLLACLLPQPGQAVDEGSWMVKGVHVYVHKSITPFNSYINLPGGGMLALHLGAEYYVHAPRTSKFKKASMTILLPGRGTPGVNPSPGLYTNGTSRIPCYIIPVLDNVSGKSVDVGIEYVAGKGWFAFYWANGFNAAITKVRDESLNAYPNATQVDMTVEVLDASTVRGTFTFTIRPPTGGTRTECSRLVFSTCEPFLQLGDSPPAPLFRFARSMAFLSGWGADNYTYDKSDNTVMTDARFAHIQLWDQAGMAYPWNWNYVEYAWSVQSSNIVNIDLVGSGASVTDQMSIRQQVWYPLRCVIILNKCTTAKKFSSSVPQVDAGPPYAKRWNIKGWTTLTANQNSTTCWDNNVAATEWHFFQDSFTISGQATSSRCTDNSGNSFNLLELDNKAVMPGPKENYVNLLANKSSSTCSSTGLGTGTWSSKTYYRLTFTDGSHIGWTYSMCNGSAATRQTAKAVSAVAASSATADAADTAETAGLGLQPEGDMQQLSDNSPVLSTGLP